MTASQKVPFREAVSYWWRLGLTSFGGPAGQISMLHDEVVFKRRWISDKRFLHALNYCMILPGPEAQQLVTYIGWLMHGVRGGIIAGALFVLPSLILLITLSWLYIAWGDSTIVATMFETIKPVVVAVIAQAVYRIGSRSLRHPLLWGIAIVSTALMLVSGSLFPAIVVGAALIGFIGQRMSPQVFSGKVGHTSTEIAGEPAIIDDDTPTPAHAVIKKRRLLLTGIVSAALWFLPVLILWVTVGPGSPLVHMALFFSGAAFLTFGGAYAVLPYVYNGAVTAGWATPSQMVDGLALGETTPGPLIMIVSFVGFIGGYVGEFFGPGTSAVSGIVAALVVTWFTFLPSFFFIIAGGPYFEATRGSVAFTAPLTAINAAVVGVVLSLAITFASHVLIPGGQSVNVLAATITVAAGAALFVFKRSIIEVVGAAAVLGAVIGTASFLMS
jgi:chromate transporter